MSNMTTEIPSHHIKQTICATRPAYREGRHPKAVKVYTVNNESCYLLIQGVPSVGAMQELHKLCLSFGCVEYIKALDEYPLEDKYSEVYLVKYQKIQSARFAKRKLDDHSFFGGALHVCYAPEYESVAETREKLQDRRRVIAAKIRQHAQNTEGQQAVVGIQQNSIKLADTSERKYLFPQEEQSPVQAQHCLWKTSAVLPVSEISHNTEGVGYSVSRPQRMGHESDIVMSNIGHQSGIALSSIGHESDIALSSNGHQSDIALQTFHLQPPPKSEPISHFQKGNNKSSYEFSRVRSSHATFPAGYDARLLPVVLNKFTHPEIKPNIALHMAHTDVQQSEGSMIMPSSELHPKFATVSSPAIIVRDYKLSKPAPRFVPRQALKSNQSKSVAGAPSQRRTDPLDQEIRKNAFHLGDTQGPAVIPQRKRALTTAAQQSVNETISEIRNKISKVITQTVVKQK